MSFCWSIDMNDKAWFEKMERSRLFRTHANQELDVAVLDSSFSAASSILGRLSLLLKLNIKSLVSDNFCAKLHLSLLTGLLQI